MSITHTHMLQGGGLSVLLRSLCETLTQMRALQFMPLVGADLWVQMVAAMSLAHEPPSHVPHLLLRHW